MYRYSVIIPHRNLLKLLIRLLDSIPQRSDLEIIIVDNSDDSNLLNSKEFSARLQPSTKIIYSSPNLGAGGARNLGLEHATGEYLIFADADDFFTPEFAPILDSYASAAADLIFFNVTSVESDTLEPAARADFHQRLMKKYFRRGAKNLDILKYNTYPVWGKFFARHLIIKNKIKFDETSIANDVMFSLRAAVAARKIIVEPRSLYVVTARGDSIQGAFQTQPTAEQIETQFQVFVRAFKFLQSKNLRTRDFRRAISLRLLEAKKNNPTHYNLIKKTLLENGLSSRTISNFEFLTALETNLRNFYHRLQYKKD